MVAIRLFPGRILPGREALQDVISGACWPPFARMTTGLRKGVTNGSAEYFVYQIANERVGGVHFA